MIQRRPKSRKTLTGLIALLALFGEVWPSSALNTQGSSDWQRIDVSDLFSFRLPPGFCKRSSSGVVDERGEWYKAQTKVVYVWGRTESPAYHERQQPWMNDYKETTTGIGGRRANIRTYWKTTNGKRRYQAELNVGNWDKGEVQLYMRVEGTDPGTPELANQIFKSVTLPLPPPERPVVG